jgi:hypothetical protein
MLISFEWKQSFLVGNIPGFSLKIFSGGLVCPDSLSKVEEDEGHWASLSITCMRADSEQEGFS